MNRKLNIYKLVAPILASLLVFMWVPVAQAATLTSLSDTLSRLKVSETSDHTIVFTTPSGIDVGDTVTITFPSTSFTMGASLSGVTINAGAVTSASWSAPTLTITASASSTVAAAGTATISIPNAQITNPSADATYILTIGGTFGDSGKIAVVIIADDQIPVTASVNPTITFTVANTTLDLGILDSGAIRTSSYNNITIGTNGSGGYAITVRDDGNGSNPGLNNVAASKLIASADATPLTTNTEGYGGQCNKVSGSGTCSFTGTGENVDGFLLTGQTFASHGSKPSGTDTFQIRVKATVSTATEAGAYTDTLTLVGTANF